MNDINKISDTSIWLLDSSKKSFISRPSRDPVITNQALSVLIKCFKKPEFAHVINRIFLSLNCIGTKGRHGNFCPAELGIADADFTLRMNG